jgi:ADP-ribose pyrophosphatase
MFDGKIVKVSVDRVRLPHGKIVDTEVVRHSPAVVLLAMPDAEHVILARQYRYVVDREMWELPAGSVDPGEDPAVAAARECEEEIALVPGGIERLAGFYSTPGFCRRPRPVGRGSALQDVMRRPS